MERGLRDAWCWLLGFERVKMFELGVKQTDERVGCVWEVLYLLTYSTWWYVIAVVFEVIRTHISAQIVTD